MAFMDWSDTYGLGVDAMDQQHRGLIDAMNRLYDRNAAGARPVEVMELVDELFRLAADHFAEEEAFMESFGYPDLKKHKMIHKTLVDRLGGHRADVEKAGRAGEEFFDFLKFWLASHICGIDAKYAAAHQAAASGTH